MKKEHKIFNGMKYIINYPSNFEEGKAYPVIVFLHGAGSRGENISLLEGNPFFHITDNLNEFPFISIAPLCHTNTWFDIFETLKNLVYHIMKFDFVDKKRIYLMGASMGGYATWQLAMSMPEYFAAAVPICGGGMYWNAERLKNVPIWAFHGEKDNVVSVEESKKMVDSVNQKGGHAKLTIYPENGHDAWSDTYSNHSVYSWLLSHLNCNTEKITDIYDDSKTFG